MSLPDTLLIGTTDLQTVPGIVVTDVSGLRSPVRRRGDSYVVPGRTGQVGVGKVVDAYAFTVPIAVLPDDGSGATPASAQARRAQMLANLDAVAALMPSGLVTLKRRLSTASSYVEHVAAGEYVDGLAAALLNAETGETELQFVNLDGCWYDTTTTATITSGTSTVAGTVDTRNMVITFGGAATLTNTTLGVHLQVSAGTVIDVQAGTSSAGLDKIVAWGGDSQDALFALRPGSNVLTGSGSVAYKAAWS